PGRATAEGHRSIPPVVARPTHDDAIAVGGQRDGHALAGASHSVAADELLALLRPNPTSTGEYPCRPRLAVIGPAAQDGSIAVSGQPDRHALPGFSHSPPADELLPLLRPATAAAREPPRSLGPPATHDGSVAVGGKRD